MPSSPRSWPPSAQELQGHLSGVALDYAVLQAKNELAVAAGLMRPFLSANDRSRWCTVRALVEPDMRVPGTPDALDKVIDAKVIDAKVAGGKLKMRPGWDTINLVFHDGHYYSSKPPLESTLMAAEYWAIFHATGKTLGTHPYEIGRFMLFTINGGCLLLMFVFTARQIERLGTSDWGRIFVMACCVFGTFLTTFAVTITNHLPAAACTAVLLDALVRIWFDGDRRTWTFVIAGFFSAMLVASEIPAGLLSALVTLVVFCMAAKKTLIAYLPPALLVTAAFFGTNWIAVHDLKPAQMHRGGHDNWYDYPGSYWNAKQGIDAGEKSAGVYALNVLVGHHGIFSLTPIWLLFVLGTGIWLVHGSSRRLPGEGLAPSSPLPPGEGQGVRGVKVRAEGQYHSGRRTSPPLRRSRPLCDARLYGVLHLVSGRRSQLWRQRLGVSLGLLAGPAVAGVDVAGGRPDGPPPLVARLGLAALGGLRLVVPLSDMESLDRPVAHELSRLHGLAVREFAFAYKPDAQAKEHSTDSFACASDLYAQNLSLQLYRNLRSTR